MPYIQEQVVNKGARKVIRVKNTSNCTFEIINLVLIANAQV